MNIKYAVIELYSERLIGLFETYEQAKECATDCRENKQQCYIFHRMTPEDYPFMKK